MIGYESPHLSLLVSDKHNIIIASPTWRNGWSAYKKVEAENLTIRKSEFRIPVAVDSDMPGVNLSKAELSFLGWFLTDGSLDRTSNAIKITQSQCYPTHIQHIRETIEACGFKYSEKITPAATYYGTGYPD